MDAPLNNGPQPIIDIMSAHNLTAHDVTSVSDEQITHKMVKRAREGRRLSQHVKLKVRNAINKACQGEYTLKDLFNY